MTRFPLLLPCLVRVRTSGVLPSGTAERARGAVEHVLAHRSERVLGVEVRLTQQQNPGVIRTARAEAELDLGDHVVRAQVAAATMAEAIDLLAGRLAARLIRLSDRERAVQRPRPYAHRPERIPRAPGRRDVVRRKHVRADPATVDDAVFAMEALDHDFYLFADATTGADSVLSHGGPTGYRLTRALPCSATAVAVAGAVAATGMTAQVSVNPVPAARLTVDEAVRRLEAAAAPFLFFVEPTTTRGTVLYHRFDGHYGLVSLAPDPHAADRPADAPVDEDVQPLSRELWPWATLSVPGRW